ncbi:CPBP family intramembrane glutamic endopeptidase [Dyella amyloliquefaciens]|uniref:CPBP family intramembrane glutamic endopeptidase n=1 Tax=Dyella amyloliquefaciens TaxID=1770545 RepID=UPI00102E928A|nr:CPBP family intramembrane glutamic endopeptidase [Dyella amyloliquefaciens]
MREHHRLLAAGKAVLVLLVLMAALSVRDIGAAVGIRIPGLPLSSFGGSSMDNLLAVLLAVLAALALRPRDGRIRLAGLLGLGAPGWRAPCLVLLSTAPFWISSAISGRISADLDLRALLFTALLFPLAEELVFRGFGFIFPRRALGWSVLPACLVQAFCFGAIHWLGLRGSDEAITVFCMTFLGGIVFAMLDALNGYTLWCGLAFHCSLNAAWSVFDLSGASGGWGWINNLLRFACAIVAVLVLWRTKAKREAVQMGRAEAA